MFNAHVRSVHCDDFSFGPQNVEDHPAARYQWQDGMSALRWNALVRAPWQPSSRKKEFMSSSCRAACAAP